MLYLGSVKCAVAELGRCFGDVSLGYTPTRRQVGEFSARHSGAAALAFGTRRRWSEPQPDVTGAAADRHRERRRAEHDSHEITVAGR